MSSAKFLKGEAFKFGWAGMKSNLGVFVVSVLILFAVTFIFTRINQQTEPGSLQYILVMILQVIAQSILTMGLIKMSLRVYDNQQPEIGDLFACYPLTLRYLGASILLAIIVVVGLILLVIPGIIFMVRFQFFAFYMVDQNMGVMQSLKASWNVTRGSAWNLFLFMLLLLLLNIVGFIALMVGLLFTVTISYIAWGYIYRKLTEDIPPVQA